MSEVYFQKQAAGKGVSTTDIDLKILINYEEPVEAAYPIGTIDSDIVDMLKKVEQNRRSEIKIPKEFGDLKATVKTYKIYGDDNIDFDGDGNRDFMLLRTVNVPKDAKNSTSLSWLVAILDNGDGIISPDEEKAGIVIASGMMAGDRAPITNIKTADYNMDGLTDVNYSKEGGSYKAIASREKVAASPDDSRDLVLSAMKFYDPVVQAPEAAYVKMFIRKEFGAEVEAVEPTKAVAIPEVLRPLYTSIKEAVIKDPTVKTLAGIFLRDADQSLSVSSDELTYRVDALSVLTKKFREFEKSLKWNDKPMVRPAYEQMMGEEPNDDIRLKMAENYEANFAPMYAEDGEYKTSIEKMNEIARKYGFNNYAEMRIKERFGVTMPEFKKWVAETLDSTKADAEAYVKELKRFSGNEGLGYWDVGYWNKAWVKSVTGMEQLPELSEADALKVIKAFFKDMGFDMNAPPYKNIVMDKYYDEMKENVPGTAATATNDLAYFTSNLDPAKKIPLANFETVIHELTHDMHYQTAAKQLKGYSTYQNNGYPYVYEGLTMTTQDLPFATPTLMKRYFGGMEGFNDKFFEVYGQAKRKMGSWQIRQLLTMALMEINLYENTAPWGERLKVWDKMVKDNLFVEPKGIKLGQILCRSHPYGEQSQLGYASYPLGYATVKRIREAIIKEGTPKELKAYGDAMKRIMATGATGDLSTLLKEVEKAKAK